MRRNLEVKNMVMIALFAALMCVLAPFALPIGPVPMSLISLILYFSVYIQGWKKTIISYGAYLALGVAGVPVFTNFEGGVGKLAGPTGGYLVGFFAMIMIMGVFMRTSLENRKIMKGIHFVGMVLGTLVAYAFGTVWFCYSTGSGILPAFMVCVFPFISTDVLKIIIALAVAPALAKQIKQIDCN